MRILVVDDDKALRESLLDIFEAHGYRAESAKDGAEAVQKCRENRYDLIFIDIKMPVMNGVESHKEIKKIQPGAVVVMITAYLLEELVEEALRNGAHGVFYKPLEIKKIMNIIESLYNSFGMERVISPAKKGIREREE